MKRKDKHYAFRKCKHKHIVPLENFEYFNEFQKRSVPIFIGKISRFSGLSGCALARKTVRQCNKLCTDWLISSDVDAIREVCSDWLIDLSGGWSMDRVLLVSVSYTEFIATCVQSRRSKFPISRRANEIILRVCETKNITITQIFRTDIRQIQFTTRT